MIVDLFGSSGARISSQAYQTSRFVPTLRGPGWDCRRESLEYRMVNICVIVRTRVSRRWGRLRSTDNCSRFEPELWHPSVIQFKRKNTLQTNTIKTRQVATKKDEKRGGGDWKERTTKKKKRKLEEPAAVSQARGFAANEKDRRRRRPIISDMPGFLSITPPLNPPPPPPGAPRPAPFVYSPLRASPPPPEPSRRLIIHVMSSASHK